MNVPMTQHTDRPVGTKAQLPQTGTGRTSPAWTPRVPWFLSEGFSKFWPR